MNAEDRRNIVADCAALMVRSFVLLDSRRYEPLADLFGEDGAWVRAGTPYVGPRDIVGSLNERPENLLIRHLLTNVDISVQGPDGARGTGYFLVYKAMGDGAEPPLPAPLGAPAMVAEVQDRYRRQAGEWRIERRETARIFQ